MSKASVCFFHGFASGPESNKGRIICDALRGVDISFLNPDLNGDDFLHLTMDRWQTTALHAVQNCDRDKPL